MFDSPADKIVWLVQVKYDYARAWHNYIHLATRRGPPPPLLLHGLIVGLLECTWLDRLFIESTTRVGHTEARSRNCTTPESVSSHY